MRSLDRLRLAYLRAFRRPDTWQVFVISLGGIWAAGVVIFLLDDWSLSTALSASLGLAFLTATVGLLGVRAAIPADHVKAEETRINALIGQIQHGERPSAARENRSPRPLLRVAAGVALFALSLTISAWLFGTLLYGSLVVIGVIAILFRSRGQRR